MAQAEQAQQQQAAMAQAMQEAEIRKAVAETTEAEADAEKAGFETLQTQVELMAQTGQLNAAIGQIVQQEVARALQGTF